MKKNFNKMLIVLLLVLSSFFVALNINKIEASLNSYISHNGSDADEGKTSQLTAVINNAGKDNINEQNTFEDYQNDAKDILIDYVGIDFSDQVSDILDEAYDLIDDAKTKEEVDQIIIDTKKAIDKQIIKEEFEKHQVFAKDDLKDYVKEEYSYKIQDILDIANNLIDGAKTIEEIDQILIDTKEAINTQLELQDYQIIAKDILQSYLDEGFSDEVQSILDEAHYLIDNAENIQKIDIIISDTKDEIDVQIEKEEFEQHQDSSLDDLRDYVEGEYSDEVQDILDDAYTLILKVNTRKTIDQIVNKAKDDIDNQIEKEEFEQYQETSKDELDDYIGENPSNEVLDILDEAYNLIDDAKNKAEIDLILTNTKKDIDDLIEKEEFEHYQEISKDDLNNYAGENPNDEILDILNEAHDDIDEAINKAQIDSIVEDAKENIDKVRSPKTEITTEDFDETKDYKDDTSDRLYGSVYNEKGIKDDVSLVVAKVDLSIKSETDIKKYIEEGSFNIIKDWIDKTELDGQAPFAQLEIKLVGEDGNPVSNDTYVGTYVVKFLLPKNLREYKNIIVVYLDEIGDTLEIFNTTRDNNWITFETNHFSYFYLIGDPIEETISLWWLIILLAVIIVLEVAIIVVKTVSAKEKRVNSITLPIILAAFAPKGAIIIIIIEVVIVVILLVYIIYLFLDFIKKLFKKY